MTIKLFFLLRNKSTVSKKQRIGDFPGGPVVKTPHLTLQRVWVPYLLGELISSRPHVMVKKEKAILLS